MRTSFGILCEKSHVILENSRWTCVKIPLKSCAYVSLWMWCHHMHWYLLILKSLAFVLLNYAQFKFRFFFVLLLRAHISFPLTQLWGIDMAGPWCRKHDLKINLAVCALVFIILHSCANNICLWRKCAMKIVLSPDKLWCGNIITLTLNSTHMLPLPSRLLFVLWWIKMTMTSQFRVVAVGP